MSADRLTKMPGHIESHRALDGHEDMQACLAGSLHERIERHLPQQLAQPESDTPADGETSRVKLRLVAGCLLAGVDVGIDIKDEIVGIVENRCLERLERAGVVGA